MRIMFLALLLIPIICNAQNLQEDSLTSSNWVLVIEEQDSVNNSWTFIKRHSEFDKSKVFGLVSFLDHGIFMFRGVQAKSLAPNNNEVGNYKLQNNSLTITYKHSDLVIYKLKISEVKLDFFKAGLISKSMIPQGQRN